MRDLPMGSQTRHSRLEPLPPVRSPGSVLTPPVTRVETEPQRGRCTLTLQSDRGGASIFGPLCPFLSRSSSP